MTDRPIETPTDDDLKSAKTLALGTSVVSDPISGSVGVDPETGGQYGEGRYHVEDVIGAGGMGLVLKADDRSLGRDVAIKQLQDPYQKDLKATLRFIHEAQVTGRMEHPNIIPIHELGVDSRGSVFYSMKMVKGGSLKDILVGLTKQDSKFIDEYPFSRLLEIFLKICDAMAFAHKQGVIHRDLKPDNVMVGEFGEVLVLDWGLAQRQDEKDEDTTSELPKDIVLTVDSTEFTIQGGIKGTPGYMAPEQIRLSKDKTLDHRADIYALGAILYQMMTLKKPVTGMALNEILVKTLKGDITPPVELELSKRFTDHLPGKHVPPALSAVAMKALARYSDNRYDSVKELQRDIESFQEGFATQAENAGFFRQLMLLAMRHKLECSAAVFVIVAVIATALGFRGSIKSKIEIAEKQKKIAGAEILRAEAQRGIAISKAEEAWKYEKAANKSRGDIEANSRRIEAETKTIEEFTTKLRSIGPTFSREASSRIEKGDLKQALYYQDRALLLQPDDPEFLLGRIRILMFSEEFDHASEELKRLLRSGKSGDSKKQINALIDLCAKMKRHIGIEDEYRRLVEYTYDARGHDIIRNYFMWKKKFKIETTFSELNRYFRSDSFDTKERLEVEKGIVRLFLKNRYSDIGFLKGIQWKN